MFRRLPLASQWGALSPVMPVIEPSFLQRVLRAACVAGCTVVGASTASAEAPKFVISWDRAANIKEMAVHIGTMQRTQGAPRALAFIDACYRTHSLGSNYTRAFEGCLAADYMLAQALVAVISRVPAEELRKTGMAAPAEIMQAAQGRISSGFWQYGIAATDGQALLSLIDQQGMPPFLNAVFPKAATTKAP
jgi:hypothetical protein